MRPLAENDPEDRSDADKGHREHEKREEGPDQEPSFAGEALHPPGSECRQSPSDADRPQGLLRLFRDINSELHIVADDRALQGDAHDGGKSDSEHKAHR